VWVLGVREFYMWRIHPALFLRNTPPPPMTGPATWVDNDQAAQQQRTREVRAMPLVQRAWVVWREKRAAKRRLEALAVEQQLEHEKGARLDRLKMLERAAQRAEWERQQIRMARFVPSRPAPAPPGRV
jgi:hypothetical protein